MSLYDVRELFATGKEMIRRRSRSCIEKHDAVIHKSTGQRADKLISVSLSQLSLMLGVNKPRF